MEDQRLGDDLSENCRWVESVAEQPMDDQRLVEELVEEVSLNRAVDVG